MDKEERERLRSKLTQIDLLLASIDRKAQSLIELGGAIQGQIKSIEGLKLPIYTMLGAELEAEKEASLNYETVRDLAIHIWEEHYKEDAPKWKPCDTLMAVITQIDNMVTGLTRDRDT